MSSCDRLSQESCTCCQNSAILTGSYFRPAKTGWTYRRIAAHVGHNALVVCRCFVQWSMEHSQGRIPGSGRPRSTDARQDRRIVRAAVAAPRQQPGHMLHLLCHQGPLGIVCMQQDSDYVCLWPVNLRLYNRGYARPPFWFCVERELVI